MKKTLIVGLMMVAGIAQAGMIEELDSRSLQLGSCMVWKAIGTQLSDKWKSDTEFLKLIKEIKSDKKAQDYYTSFNNYDPKAKGFKTMIEFHRNNCLKVGYSIKQMI